MEAIYVCVHNKRTGISSYVWRLGGSGTSFYLKALPEALTGIKVSLHGPDPTRGLEGGFKIGPDGPAVDRAIAAGGVMVGTPSCRAASERACGARLAIPLDARSVSTRRSFSSAAQ